MNWWEEEHLETDFSKFQIADVVSDIHDQPATQRIYGSPLYDQNGNMRCRCCGGYMARSFSRHGHGVASCSNIGCEAHGFEFAEGSFVSNPGRTQ